MLLLDKMPYGLIIMKRQRDFPNAHKRKMLILLFKYDFVIFCHLVVGPFWVKWVSYTWLILIYMNLETKKGAKNKANTVIQRPQKLFITLNKFNKCFEQMWIKGIKPFLREYLCIVNCKCFYSQFYWALIQNICISIYYICMRKKRGEKEEINE